jgi:hypothetical protein
VNPLTEDNHQLVGLLHPNPTYDELVLHAALVPGSHIRETRGYQVEHYYAPPAQLAIEATAVFDETGAQILPEVAAIEPVKARKPRAPRKAVAAQ